ncbi:putative oligosaccaryltransferase [Colletotrichum sublineola]|uniref:Dolichyl-diphosphooligosaccharide--protein glycosyltransferase subunit 4 n=1 Tax=Colletotrichum sublineola TaxID=1173701 RepID=A0A066X903_COLSU|nr:putative oligosaccaryltransferase [Colletotrichum sublineola]
MEDRQVTPAPSAESSSGLSVWPSCPFGSTPRFTSQAPYSPKPNMISDNDLYRLAIFLGSAAMVLIILYHYVEVNREEEQPAKAVQPAKSAKAVS